MPDPKKGPDHLPKKPPHDPRALKLHMPLSKTTAGMPGQTWTNLDANEVREYIRTHSGKEDEETKTSFFGWLRRWFKRS